MLPQVSPAPGSSIPQRLSRFLHLQALLRLSWQCIQETMEEACNSSWSQHPPAPPPPGPLASECLGRLQRPLHLRSQTLTKARLWS